MDLAELYVPHAGWFSHETGDEVARFLSEGWFEYREQAFLWLYLRPGDTFLDCGAHIGLFSLVAAQAMNRLASIIAIEPHPDSAFLLDQNLRANGVSAAAIRQAAVYSRSGSMGLSLGEKGRAAYSSLCSMEGAAKLLPVEVLTLDDLLSGAVALAKIDVEGSELEVLEGAEQSIGKGFLPLLLIECTEENLKRSGANTKDLFQALHKRGYAVCRFDAESSQLVKRDYSGAIGYENLFAAQHLEEANHRLRTAPASNRKIAHDILTRGAASEKLFSQGALLRESDQRVSEARQRAEESAQATGAAFRALGEANWRADEAEKRVHAAALRTAEAHAAAAESERRAEEARKRSETAAQSAEAAYRGLGEANWRAEQSEKRAEAAEIRADEARRQSENLLRSAEVSLRRLGTADWRVEQAEDKSRETGDALLESAALAAGLRLRLEEILRSRYLRAGWKLGLSRKPEWVDLEIPLVKKRPVAETVAETEMMRGLRHLNEKKFRPRVVLDIGAGKGYWSIVTGAYFKEASFYLLDPLTENEPDLRHLCETDARQHYILTGVGEAPETRTIHVAPELDASTMLMFPGAEEGRIRTLSVTTVDLLLQEGRIERPDLVKIDVQGMELQVLRGSQQLFDYTEVFIIEVNLFEFMPGCPRVHEVIRYMADRNYFLFDLAGSLRRPFEDDLGQLDLVLVSGKSPLIASNKWL